MYIYILKSAFRDINCSGRTQVNNETATVVQDLQKHARRRLRRISPFSDIKPTNYTNDIQCVHI